MPDGHDIPEKDPDGLTTTEGVNERGTDREAAGRDPGSPSADERSATPGLAVGEGYGALDAAPEPNEPG
jgi:hypothetical protein